MFSNPSFLQIMNKFERHKLKPGSDEINNNVNEISSNIVESQ